MYKLLIEDKLDKKFRKLSKNDKQILIKIDNKIQEILKNPLRYKNLRNVLKGIKRVHVDKHFVLIFEVNEKLKEVKFLDFNHHDKIYIS